MGNKVVSLNNIKQQRLAKITIGHLEKIIRVCELAIRGFKVFNMYLPVQRMIHAIEVERKILQLHLEQNRKIVTDDNSSKTDS